MAESFLYLDDDEHQLTEPPKKWNVLIVDDDEEIHKITLLALKDFVLDEGGINFISAYSGEQAIQFLSETDDRSIAIILLDVVMETNTAGFEVANFVRKKLDNHFTRIILRTGQPADIPEQQVVMRYDINDYKAKAELTYSRLFITMVTSLRAYNELIQRKNRENELEKSKAAVEIANKAKSTFIARMSHELLTPLNAIIGFSQLQQLYMTPDASSQDKELTANILNAGYHLKMLVDDILDIIQTQNSVKKLPLCSCELGVLVNDSISLVRLNAEQKNISIHVEDTDLKVLANFERLKQCLVNLLTNAIKFNHDNGKIYIKFSAVMPNKIKIMVVDTGVGIATEDQDLIFDMFSRSNYAEQQEIQGSGVGLSLIKKLVLQMEGEVGFTSTLDQGSEFWLAFEKV